MSKPPDRKRLDHVTGVINVGLDAFASDLAELGVDVVHVDWAPPAGGDPELASLLDQLDDVSASGLSSRVETANREALQRILAADPVLIDVVPASECIAGLGPQMILHAGPPIDWQRMCGPMRGAVAGIAVFEAGRRIWPRRNAWRRAVLSTFSPTITLPPLGPMTGLTTMSQPLMVVENRAFGNRAYCTINEGLGKVMRFGGNDADVLSRLAWLRDVLGPVLGDALRDMRGVPLKNLVARGLGMGDEMHQRNVACTGLLLRALAPALARRCNDSETLAQALTFIAGNDQFFLNIAMVLGKAMMDPVRGIEASTVVTAMSRNGTDFGIRVSGTGDEWFIAPVEMPQGLYFPGFSEVDANPDMGDSTIVETVGLGGFAMGAAPAVAGFVGAGQASEAALFTHRMREITVGGNPEWTIPALDYLGVPTGIDIRRVVARRIAPTINTGIAHREPGIGQVGAGVVEAPLGCFEQALRAFAASMGIR